MTDVQRTHTVAIIGAGEMGAAVGQRILKSGARVLTTLGGRSAASAERVRRAAIEIVEDDDEIVRRSGFILSIVPPGQAIQVAERFRPAIARAAEKPVFVDCNAISPATMEQIAAIIEACGARVVDAGIIGGPPRPERHDAGPRFYASGPHAGAAAAALGSYGIDMRLLEGPIGAASALKMSYAGLTKGLIAIGAAMLGGAHRAGLDDALRAELQSSQPELLRMMRARIPAMFPKAYRWVAEMEQIADFLESPENGAAIYEGAARLYERIDAEWQKSAEQSPVFTAIAQISEKERER